MARVTDTAPGIYPGRSVLASALVLVERGDLSEEDEGRVRRQLIDAVDRGLAFEHMLLATEAFFALPWCRERDHGMRSRRWLDSALSDDWLRRVRLLPAAEQYRHLETFDAETAQWLSEVGDDEQAIATCRGMVESAPIPAWRTASVLTTAIWRRVDRESSPTLGGLLGLVCDWATDPTILWRAAQRRDDFLVARGACADRLSDHGWLNPASGRSERSEFRALCAFDDRFAQVFGTRRSIYRPPGFLRGLLGGPSEESLRRLEVGVELLKERNSIIALYLGPSSDPFVHWYFEYLEGRLDGAAGRLKPATKHLRAALAIGICHDETVEYLAMLLHAQDKDAEARNVIEAAAAREAWGPGAGGKGAPTGWEDAYATVGGDPRALPRADGPPAELQATARANERSGMERFAPSLEDERRKAHAAYWSRRQRDLVEVFGRLLEPADFDAALGEATSSRTATIQVEDAARTGLDELPLPVGVDRGVLLAAVRQPASRAAIAAQALALVEGLAAEGEGAAFVASARRMPGLARSAAIAGRRARTLLASGRSDDALALLDEYQQEHGAPGEATARLLAELASSPIAAARWRELLVHGRGLVARLSGPPRSSVVATSVALVVACLDDDRQRAAWPELIEALLELDGTDVAQAHLCAWHERRVAHTDGDEAQRASELLVARLAPTHAATVRQQAQGALVAEIAAAALPRAMDLVRRALRLGPPDGAVGAELTRWYTQFTAGDGGDDLARLGEALCRALPRVDDAADRVAASTRAHLVRALDAPSDQAGLRSLVERVLALPAAEDTNAAAVVAWFGGWRGLPGARGDESAAELGEWLLADGRMAARDGLRPRVAAHLRALLARARRRRARIAVLERLARVLPGDAAVIAELVSARREARRVMTIAVAATVVMVVLVGLIAVALSSSRADRKPASPSAMSWSCVHQRCVNDSSMASSRRSLSIVIADSSRARDAELAGV